MGLVQDVVTVGDSAVEELRELGLDPEGNDIDIEATYYDGEVLSVVASDPHGKTVDVTNAWWLPDMDELIRLDAQAEEMNAAEDAAERRRYSY
jgi:hypothetical protein